MDSLSQQERDKYEAVWAFDVYRERSPGMRFLDDAIRRLNPPIGSTFLDIGCGTGRVSKELRQRGYEVTAMDIAANACQEYDGPFLYASVWDIGDVGAFDFGFCADVMEHLPTDRVDLAIAEIARVCSAAYFQIANFEDHGEMIGGGVHLHLTVKPVGWWADALRKHFDFLDITAETKHHIAVCRNASPRG